MTPRALLWTAAWLLALPGRAQDTASAQPAPSALLTADSAAPEFPADTAETATPDDASAPDAEPTPSNAELAERVAMLEEALFNQEVLADSGVTIYGFFDLTFNKFFVQKDSFFDGAIFDQSTFFMQNLNVYMASRMTDTLSAMVELGFTFLPLGHVKSFGVPGVSAYDRVDTTVTDPYSSEEVRLGGVRIVRAHLTWQPREWFGIVAGRYLTPYGIWNEDHASTVILAIRPPFLQTSHFVPLEQTGLQVRGSHTLGNHILSYALTLSNGRGPIESVHDLDEHKAVGLRLRAVYEKSDWKLAIGTYGLWTTYTDTSQDIVSVSPFDVDFRAVDAHTEWIATVDVLAEFKGVRIQMESAHKRVHYTTRPLLEPRDSGAATTGLAPDYTGHTAYVLLGWELPLHKWLGDVRITPYAAYEHVNENDTRRQEQGANWLGGINVQPSPFVRIKAEYVFVYFPNWKWNDLDYQYFSGISSQLAVSF